MQTAPTRCGWRWAIVAAYMAAIFLASSGPAPPLPPGANWDKVLHAGAYAGLSALAIWAAARGRVRTAGRRVLLVGCVIAIVYGATDEWHQYFVPGRECDVADFAADAAGALAAAGAIRAWGIIARGSD